MLDEVLFTQVDSGLPISHIVLMGIGEPLDNFDNVMRFLELVNSPEDAKELLRRLKGLPAHFNLIPLNHVEESPLKPSTRAAVAAFQKTLEDGGVTATVRRTLGGDIDASCGQLRRKYNQSKEKR